MKKQSMTFVFLGGLFIAMGGYYGMMEVDMEPVAKCENPTIKGNVTANNKVYHVPGGVYYDQLDIEPENGDKLFCSEVDAQAEGFRKSKR